jgi:hypothetical protein
MNALNKNSFFFNLQIQVNNFDRSKLIRFKKITDHFLFISPDGDAILKILKIMLNACIILLLLLYLIGAIFSVNFNF